MRAAAADDVREAFSSLSERKQHAVPPEMTLQAWADERGYVTAEQAAQTIGEPLANLAKAARKGPLGFFWAVTHSGELVPMLSAAAVRARAEAHAARAKKKAAKEATAARVAREQAAPKPAPKAPPSFAGPLAGPLRRPEAAVREPAPPKRTYFLHVRGPNRGAEVEVVDGKAVGGSRVEVRVLNTGAVLLVRPAQVRPDAPAPDTQVVGGGLPTLGRRGR